MQLLERKQLSVQSDHLLSARGGTRYTSRLAQNWNPYHTSDEAYRIEKESETRVGSEAVSGLASGVVTRIAHTVRGVEAFRQPETTTQQRKGSTKGR